MTVLRKLVPRGVRHGVSAQVARDLRIELVSLDELCARADYLSLHMPSTAETRHIFNAARLALAIRRDRLSAFSFR